MKQFSFHDGWKYGLQGAEKIPVTLPHDAQLLQPRAADAPGGSGHAFYPGGVYEYEKTFEVPADWNGKAVLFEFEGIYKNSTVTINGKAADGHAYGYTGFTVNATPYLHYGATNVIAVTADNAQLPNSRWYTGGGIYRPVWLWLGEATHIACEGVKITTLSYAPARVRVETAVVGDTPVEIELAIVRNGKTVATGTGACAQLTIPDACLWSDTTPNLYECRVALTQNGRLLDKATERFGIRVVEWSAKGLFINGRETLLRGGCVHHDNGVLGAATYAKSEERRVRILKQAGFNAIRSAHNPCSKAMLDACDEHGMYMMDETFDMWYNRKTKHDYGCDFDRCWQEDTAAMVSRDYNHPSVILYSIGNEVAEPHEQKGIDIGRAQVELIHSIDATRPVTCGVNLMILGRAAKGQGIYQDGAMGADVSKRTEKVEKNQNASLAFNIMASFIGTGMNKGGNSPKVDALAAPFADSLDIVGYNYGSGRYPLDGTAHPKRVIFGSETFPQDIAKNWAMVKQYPYLIGDFMWTAWDYIGEAGIGAWSYTGGMPFNRPYPWLLAGAGVIDILGVPDASCRYAAVVWEQQKKPCIGVRPVNHPGVRPSKSVWRGTNAVESWAWQGCDGNKALVEVFSPGASVELLLNGHSLGKKKLKEYQAVYHLKYAPGTLCAVAYDAAGREISRNELLSATGQRRLQVLPEESAIAKGDIAYVNIAISGENGVVESNADAKLTVQVEGGTLLGFGSANPCTEESFVAGSYTTYQGRAQAVVRADAQGDIKITVKGGGFAPVTATIQTKG